MKAKHRKTLAAIFSNPVNGNMEWAKIEALLVALAAALLRHQAPASPLRKTVSGRISTGRTQKKKPWYTESRMPANF